MVPPGDQNLSALYLEERVRMVRLARLITGSNTLAEEVVQEAFTRLQARLEGIENPGGYLRAVVVNLCRTELRRRGLEARRVASDEPSVILPPEIDETWSAVCRLPFRQRTVLALRFYEDLSEAEIARVLDCRIGTVKSALHRGLARLRKELS